MRRTRGRGEQQGEPATDAKADDADLARAPVLAGQPGTYRLHVTERPPLPGAQVVPQRAQLEPSRVEQLVLVDLVGSPDQRAAVPVVASVNRLGTVYPSAQAAIALIKQIGIIPVWDQYWDRYFTYELREVSGGVASSSDRGAVLEDLGYGEAMYWPDPDPPIHSLWNAITMPALVLRARKEIMPGFGFILPAADAERFAAAVPSARVVEIDANHYTITMHDDSIAAIGGFLRTS
jgi:hypothetical protein